MGDVYHRIDALHNAGSVGVDAHEQLRRSENPRLREDSKDRSGPVYARAFGIFAGVKQAAFWLLNLWKTIGMPPLSRQDLFK